MHTLQISSHPETIDDVCVLTALDAGPRCLEFDPFACYFCDWAWIIDIQISAFI